MRKEAIPEISYNDTLRFRFSEKQVRAVACLSFPLSTGAHHGPTHVNLRALVEKLQDGATATNLNVVTVRAQTKNVVRRIRRFRELQTKHRLSGGYALWMAGTATVLYSGSRFQTSHGASPDA